MNRNCLLIVTIISFVLMTACLNEVVDSNNNIEQKINSNYQNKNLNLEENYLNKSSELKNNDDIFVESKFGSYSYTYKKEGEKTVGMFVKNFLPRDDTIVVGAIRDVIKKSYNEVAESSPSLKDHNGISKIYLESEKNRYYINLIKQDTGEVHSLVIEKEKK